MKMNSKLKIVLVVAASLAVGAVLGSSITHFTQREPTEAEDTSRKPRDFQDLLAAYNLLTTTLEDESQLEKLNFFKTITLDRPPETITKIIKQVSDAADNTLEHLDRFRELSPRIQRLPRKGDFGDNLQEAMKKDATSSLMDRSPKFSKRLLLTQAQALGMLVVLAREIEKIDPNQDRQEWLRRISNDFEKMYDAYVQHLRFAPAD